MGQQIARDGDILSSARPWVRWLPSLLLLFLLLLPFALHGCIATSGPPEAEHGRSAALLVDFYRQDTRSAACSGTLIAENVALTSAHCAATSTGARVRAP